uniref:DUF4806 domain-containing protein n=1 Tax=Loa loa TaxID=7209 RepID=A0A1I7VD44_LOALO
MAIGTQRLANDDEDILKLIGDVMYKNDSEFALQRLAQNDKNKEPTEQKETTYRVVCRLTVNLPQLPLPTFSGDSKS